MTRFSTIAYGMAVAFLVWGGTYPTNLEAQRGLPLRPAPADGHFIIPVMEGWYDNGDGSITVSFGYLNRNEGIVEVPMGETNRIEPAVFDGMQPTVFEPGHQAGIFTVTVPADMVGTDVWWTIRSAGEEARVPGRKVPMGYQLDKFPLPNGAMAPLVSFEEGGEVGQYPPGLMATRVESVRVGELLTLTLQAADTAVRDTTIEPPRNPLMVNVAWSKHQGPPGEIEWVRHPSTPVPEEPAEDAPADNAGGDGNRPLRPAGPNEVRLPAGGGTAQVQARFSVPGEYLLRARVDPSDARGGQCCWTNAYVRVNVTP
jgi:hypothetical protein